MVSSIFLQALVSMLLRSISFIQSITSRTSSAGSNITVAGLQGVGVLVASSPGDNISVGLSMMWSSPEVSLDIHLDQVERSEQKINLLKAKVVADVC